MCLFVLFSKCYPILPSGYSVARVRLGDYYYYGFGTEENLEEAVDQYRMAADHMGNAQAMFNLGYMYELGIGLQEVREILTRCTCMAAKHADLRESFLAGYG